MINKLFVEFIGTFIFLSVILTTGDAFAIGLALAVAIYFGGKVSGGHFNPAVSVMMFLNKGIKMEELLGYVISQCLGGAFALSFYKANK